VLKEITIPNERIAVLIGSHGTIKNKICNKTNVKIEINENSVLIIGEPFNVLDAEKIIYAIGRGFSPKNAFVLLNEDYYIDTIKLPKEKNILSRIRARIIGRRGYVKRYIENSTNTLISIYGKTVCIIGKDTNIASESIKMILNGKKLSTVFKFLEKRKKEEMI